MAIICCLLLAADSYSYAQIVLRQGGVTAFRIKEETPTGFYFVNTLNDLIFDTISTEKGDFLQIRINGYSKTNAIGLPELPVMSRLLEIPDGAVPKINIIHSECHDYELSDFGYHMQVLPAQAPAPKTAIANQQFAFSEKAYKTNTFSNFQLVRVDLQGNFRASRLANLVLSPVDYNPASGILRVYDNIEAEIIFENADINRTIAERQRLKSPYFISPVSKALNARSLKSLESGAVQQPVKYVIVADPIYREVLRPFVKWKTQKGFHMIEAYTDDPSVGKTAADIKSYLQQLYMQAYDDDPAPTFVLFAGDITQVPSFSCGTHVSDLYYCEFTGDNLPDMFYGRFPALTVADMQAMIDKTLQYEQYTMPDPSFLGRATLIAGADATHQLTWGNGQMSYAANTYFNPGHSIETNTYLQPEPSGGQYAQHVLADINQGVAFANYTAHGNSFGWTNPAFNLNTINSLSNKDKYCFLIGNCCETSTYQKSCLAVEIVKAAGKGALGYIGASDLSYWDEDYWWAVGSGEITSNPVYGNKGLGAYDRIFHDHGEPRETYSATMGQILFGGNMSVQESNSPIKKYYWEVYCLMGDPSLMVYFSVPPVLQASFARQLPVAAHSVEVQTEPYAYVAVSKDNILYGTAEAGSDGIANVPLQPFHNAGKAVVTITAQNRKPFIDTLALISPQGAFTILNKWKVNDVEGNENGLAEPGEKLMFDAELKNLGMTTSANSVVRISCNDQNVIVYDSIHIWPSIAAGDSLLQKNAFTLSVKKEVPDMHKVRINVTCISDTSVFSGSIILMLNAPKLENGNFALAEKFMGNGNGLPEAGETLDLKFTVTNTGHSQSDSLKARIIVLYGDHQYSSAVQSIAALASGESHEMHFPFAISRNTAAGTVFRVLAPVTSNGYHTEASFDFTSAQQTEDFEKGKIQASYISSSSPKPWETDSIVRYEGRFAAKSGAIGDLDQSEMYIEAIFLTDQNITFYRKVSSENGYDFLKFIVDGNELSAWSGNRDWARVTFPIKAGTHKLSWTYVKDEATVWGKDAAWIDMIELPPFSVIARTNLAVQVLAVPPAVCPGSPVQLYAFATGGNGGYNYNWSPAGTLSNSLIFNPVSYFDTAAVYTVTVGSGTLTETSSISLEKGTPAETPVVTLAGDHISSSLAEGNQWYSSSGAVDGAIAQDFFPERNDTYYVVTTDSGGCPSAPSNSITFLGTGIHDPDKRRFTVSPNPFQDVLNIEYHDFNGKPGAVELYDVFGKKISETPIPRSGIVKLDTRGLPASIYLCKIAGEKTIKVLKLSGINDPR